MDMSLENAIGAELAKAMKGYEGSPIVDFVIAGMNANANSAILRVLTEYGYGPSFEDTQAAHFVVDYANRSTTLVYYPWVRDLVKMDNRCRSAEQRAKGGE